MHAVCLNKREGVWRSDVGVDYADGATEEQQDYAETQMYKWRLWAAQRKRDRGVDCPDPEKPERLVRSETWGSQLVDCVCVRCEARLYRSIASVKQSAKKGGVYCDDCRKKKIAEGMRKYANKKKWEK